MKKAILFFVILFASSAFAHGAEETAEQLPEPVQFLYLAFFIVLAVVLLSIAKRNSMNELFKKASFSIIVASVVLSTLYLAGYTVYENITSATGGPVHWHADFEVWVCGEKLELQESSGLEGRVGTSLFHHHNDLRIHVEGTVRELEDVFLEKFFQSIGGDFHKDFISVILEDGTVLEKRNGDLCNGLPGKMQLYVNGIPNNEFGEYVISPFSNVPPGDFLHIVFDSKEGVPNSS